MSCIGIDQQAEGRSSTGLGGNNSRTTIASPTRRTDLLESSAHGPNIFAAGNGEGNEYYESSLTVETMGRVRSCSLDNSRRMFLSSTSVPKLAARATSSGTAIEGKIGSSGIVDKRRHVEQL